jgi:hypothetical protein
MYFILVKNRHFVFTHYKISVIQKVADIFNLKDYYSYYYNNYNLYLLLLQTIILQTFNKCLYFFKYNTFNKSLYLILVKNRHFLFTHYKTSVIQKVAYIFYFKDYYSYYYNNYNLYLI